MRRVFSMLFVAAVAAGALAWRGAFDDQFFATRTVAAGPDTNTILLLHFDEDVGTTNFVDSSISNFAVTTVGGPYATNFAKWGNAARFSANGYLKAGFGNAAFNFGTNTNFTVECWVWFYSPQPKQHPSAFANNFGSWNNGDIALKVNSPAENPGKITVREWPGTYDLVPSGTQASNTWHHVAFVRSGSIMYWFIGGELQAAKTGVVARTFATGGPVIGGGNWDGVNSYLNGYIDELRVSRVARWTNNFTLPTGPYTP